MYQQSVLPGSITVCFPVKRCSGDASNDQGNETTPGQYYSITIPASAIPAVNYITSPFNYQIIDTACALYSYPYTAPTNPTNQATLQALATQIATDFYNWGSIQFDAVYNDVLGTVPNGLYDYIIIDNTPHEQSTRIKTAPYNSQPELLNHYDPATALSCSYTATPCIYYYGPPAFCDSSGALNLTRYQICLLDGRTWSYYVSTDAVGSTGTVSTNNSVPGTPTPLTPF